MDIFFNARLGFCISLCRDIKLNTIQHLLSRKKSERLMCIKMICQLYRRRGFQVRYIYTDNEFADLSSDLMDMGIYLNVCAANEHIPAIKRRIRVVKERHRCVRHGLPFACVPKLMTIELNYFIAYCLNAFPPKDGVSTSLSPSAIVTGHTIDYVKHCKLEFGQYVQTHEEKCSAQQHEC